MTNTQSLTIHYYQDEDGIFTAIVPAIKGCVASGKTLEEAYENAVGAIESCLEARKKIQANANLVDDYKHISSYQIKKNFSYV